MNVFGLKKLVCLTAMIFLPGCLTVADSVLTNADLIDLAALEDIEGSRKISLEIAPPQRQKISMTYSRFADMHFDYSAALVDSLKSGLSIPFEITSPAKGTPHVMIAVDRIYASGFCHTINGTPYSCSQTVKFSAWLSVDHGEGSGKPVSVNSTGTASDDSFFSAATVFEPLHKKAAHRAFERLVRATAKRVNEEIEKRPINPNQTAHVRGEIDSIFPISPSAIPISP
ncbi:MAG: hypothetical protein R8L07_08205 [Alphaproteobacteria bacterium]|nr:hypothetical protein [Alphaproteobacteria bacterium]